MADKQPYLNANFYGPTVPPSSKRHRGRRVLCTILKVAIGFIVGVGIVLLILGLVYRPHKLEFNVTSAKLTQFNITANQLYYNLGLNVTITNPNKRYRVYYDTNEMVVLYKNRRLNSLSLPAFFQDTKSTAVLSPNNFEGQRLILLAGDEIVEFNSEKAEGQYPIDVKFFFRLRMKSGEVVLKLKPKVHCGLRVPLSNAPKSFSFVFFPNTACDFQF
ncbi:NDR1/HIN1-like protein 10 [Cucurbita moschata]|uniref:NDR1/HIN1-like protein 10 n=1 Tax=Cucurbita moschata TaxID=3662 RepID=A0A6J1F4Y9_CUCMO|nr:NDR1/HIN1-like protein 10 [Cucurbita moschata]